MAVPQTRAGRSRSDLGGQRPLRPGTYPAGDGHPEQRAPERCRNARTVGSDGHHGPYGRLYRQERYMG